MSTRAIRLSLAVPVLAGLAGLAGCGSGTVTSAGPGASGPIRGGFSVCEPLSDQLVRREFGIEYLNKANENPNGQERCSWQATQRASDGGPTQERQLWIAVRAWEPGQDGLSAVERAQQEYQALVPQPGTAGVNPVTGLGEEARFGVVPLPFKLVNGVETSRPQAVLTFRRANATVTVGYVREQVDPVTLRPALAAPATLRAATVRFGTEIDRWLAARAVRA